MTNEELTEQLAAAFKARMRNRRRTPLEHGPGYSGALPVPSLPPEIVDEMEAAINEAFEQVHEEDDAWIDEAFREGEEGEQAETNGNNSD